MSMIGLIDPPMIAVMEPLRSVPKATSDGSANYEFSQRAMRASGIKRRIRPYDLRHFFATRLVEQGADINLAGRMLGHSDSKTTRRYVASVTKEVRIEFEKQSRMNQMFLEAEGLVTN
jgi:integrase